MDATVLNRLKTPRGLVAIQQVAADDVIDLRHAVLRAGLPRDAAVFEGDDLPTTMHFGAIFEDGTLVACASFLLNSYEGQPAWQLRGMATHPDFRSLGLGGALLEAAEMMIVRKSPVRFLWCNARTPALNFYQRQGWSPVSEVFEIPTAGPHVRMTRRL